MTAKREMSVTEFFAFLHSPQGQEAVLDKIKEMGCEEAANMEQHNVDEAVAAMFSAAFERGKAK